MTSFGYATSELHSFDMGLHLLTSSDNLMHLPADHEAHLQIHEHSTHDYPSPFISSGKTIKVSSSKASSLLTEMSIKHSSKVSSDGCVVLVPALKLFPLSIFSFSLAAAFLSVHVQQTLVCPVPFFLRGNVLVGPLYEHREHWLVAIMPCIAVYFSFLLYHEARLIPSAYLYHP